MNFEEAGWKLCQRYNYVDHQAGFVSVNCTDLLNGKGKAWRTLTERVHLHTRGMVETSTGQLAGYITEFKKY